MKVTTAQALAAKAWPFEEARKLLARIEARKKAGKPTDSVLFETGYGPSGLPHIGTFGEVARTSWVRHAFETISDIPTHLIAFSDDMTAQSERDYGLVRATKTGAEVFNPDCGKSSAAAKLPGVKADSYGSCTFGNRASLEKALLDLAKQSWKTSVMYRYE